MKALITGASGFVGQYLIAHCQSFGDEVVAPTSKIEGVRPELDVTDQAGTAAYISQVNPDVVYHLAGISFVPEAEENFRKACDVNVVGTYHVLRACAALNKRIRVIVVSSGEVYGRVPPEQLPITEETPTGPQNNYALTKLFCEQAALRFIGRGGVEPMIMRPFNHIGPGQNERFVVSSFAKQLALIALKKAEPVIKVGNLSARRDFTDVRDIVRAYRLAAHRGSPGIYVLASGRVFEIQTLLNRLIAVSGLKVAVEVDQARFRPVETPEISVNPQKAANELGWEPSFLAEESLREAFEFWVDQLR